MVGRLRDQCVRVDGCYEADLLLPTAREAEGAGLGAAVVGQGVCGGRLVSFFIQAAGGGMLAGQEGEQTVEMGQRIYMAGIGV